MEDSSHRLSIFFVNTYNRDFMVAKPRTSGSYPPAVLQLYITVTVYQTIAISNSHSSVLKACKAFSNCLQGSSYQFFPVFCFFCNSLPPGPVLCYTIGCEIMERRTVCYALTGH